MTQKYKSHMLRFTYLRQRYSRIVLIKGLSQVCFGKIYCLLETNIFVILDIKIQLEKILRQTL